MLSSLSKSEYTVNNSFELIIYIKTMSIPLDQTNTDNKIQTNIKKKEMKELLLLCTKNVHFSYNDIIKQQYNVH